MVAIMAGAELGFAPFQSLQSFAVVNGRPTLWGDGLVAVVRRNGCTIREWHDGETAYCEVTRPDTGETIQRTYQFSDFVKAMGFVGKVADAAEKNQHHPDILIRYNKVTLTLSTHDAGGITMKDFDLAATRVWGARECLKKAGLAVNTPLTLAETASVFGEMLTFQSLLKRESDPAKRRILLAGKVEDMLNTVVRQIAMHNFETVLHDERRAGEVMPERIAEIWLETQREALGSGVKLPKDSEYGAYWAYIPHFIHVPFYVYAYAFGDCLVNSLYAVYRNASGGFAEKYLDMLKAGGTKRHKELLAPFGLDASDPAFWTKGLDVIAGFIDELERMPA